MSQESLEFFPASALEFPRVVLAYPDAKNNGEGVIETGRGVRRQLPDDFIFFELFDAATGTKEDVLAFVRAWGVPGWEPDDEEPWELPDIDVTARAIEGCRNLVFGLLHVQGVLDNQRYLELTGYSPADPPQAGRVRARFFGVPSYPQDTSSVAYAVAERLTRDLEPLSPSVTLPGRSRPTLNVRAVVALDLFNLHSRGELALVRECKWCRRPFLRQRGRSTRPNTADTRRRYCSAAHASNATSREHSLKKQKLKLIDARRREGLSFDKIAVEWNAKDREKPYTGSALRKWYDRTIARDSAKH